jgi:hypothetical protein
MRSEKGFVHESRIKSVGIAWAGEEESGETLNSDQFPIDSMSISNSMDYAGFFSAFGK